MKSGNGLLGIVAIVAIALFFVMTAAGPGSRMSNGWSYLTTGNTAQQNTGNPQALAAPSGLSIVGGPSLSASKIDSILAGTPAAGTGQSLYDLSSQYNVDDAFALAVFKKESTFGRYGVAARSLSLGNLRCIPDASCVNGYAYFSSWQEGYSAFYKLISGPMYVGQGLVTPHQIIPKYAPYGDGNNPTGYAADVEQSVATWRQS